MFAPFNTDQIWSANPPHVNTENIKQISGGPFRNLSYGTLNFQTVANFH